MNKSLPVAALLFAFSTAAMSVYKCGATSGTVTFQETPCTGQDQGGKIEVKPASGDAQRTPAPTASAAAPAAPSTYRQSLEKLQDERRRKEAWFATRDTQQAVRKQIADCDAEQRRLAASKEWSKNNLAGATRDASISQEMQAAATMCAERVRSKQRLADDAEKVCSEIKCIAPPM